MTMFVRSLVTLVIVAGGLGAQPADLLTIDGIKRYVDANGIRNVKTLLPALPSQLRKNFVLMETSRGDRPATALTPRIISYSADARLLLSTGSHPGDELREVVDLAELNPATGFWKLRSLDFRQNPPALSADDSKCQRCHGSPARPLWSNYGDWPGAFGPDFDRLTASQATALNTFIPSQAQSDRLHALVFEDDRPYRPGQFFFIKRSYGYANTVFGFELSTAVAEGIFQRIRSNSLFSQLRQGFLLFRNGCADRSERLNSPVWRQFETNLRAAGANSVSERQLYRVLGVDVNRDFSLANLESDPNRDPFWANGEEGIFGLVAMLVLNDVAPTHAPLRQLLAATPEDPTFSVQEPNLAQALAYRIRAGWQLRGDERQAQREGNAFRLNTFRSVQGIFDPMGSRFCTTLFEAPQTEPPDPTPGAPRVWTGSLTMQGAYAYIMKPNEEIRSTGGAITATMTSPANTSFRLLLISIDKWQAVAEGAGAGNVKRIKYEGPAGRYAWYAEATKGSGAYRIEGTTP